MAFAIRDMRQAEAALIFSDDLAERIFFHGMRCTVLNLEHGISGVGEELKTCPISVSAPVCDLALIHQNTRCTLLHMCHCAFD